MDLKTFIQKWQGNYPDFDNSFGSQCVDLVQYYNREVLGNAACFTGNAVDIFGQQPDKFDWIVNTPDGVPQSGDILVWEGALNGGPGHTSVRDFGPGDANQFTSFDVNWPLNSPAHQQKHNYNFVKGWGRAKNQPGGEDMVDGMTTQQWKERAQGEATNAHKVMDQLAQVQANYDGATAELDAERKTYDKQLADLNQKVSDLQTQLSHAGGNLNDYSLGQLVTAVLNKLFKK